MILSSVFLMAPTGGVHTSADGASYVSSIIMFFIIFVLPLAWVIPIIVKKTRKKPTETFKKNPEMNESILHLEKLAKLKEQGAITEEEFLEQKKKILN